MKTHKGVEINTPLKPATSVMGVREQALVERLIDRVCESVRSVSAGNDISVNLQSVPSLLDAQRMLTVSLSNSYKQSVDNKISEETRLRIEAINELQQIIDREISNRIAAVLNLQNQVNTKWNEVGGKSWVTNLLAAMERGLWKFTGILSQNPPDNNNVQDMQFSNGTLWVVKGLQGGMPTLTAGEFWQCFVMQDGVWSQTANTTYGISASGNNPNVSEGIWQIWSNRNDQQIYFRFDYSWRLLDENVDFSELWTAIDTKLDKTVFNAHNNDNVRHITAAERAAWNAKQNALNRSIGSNDNATGTVSDSGGNLSVPIEVTVVAPSASSTQTTAASRSLRAQLKILIDNVAHLFANKVDANTAITANTKTKITYDAKGLVTSGADLSASDIPNLDASKITSGTFTDARIASAAIWNAKQDKLSAGDNVTISGNTISATDTKPNNATVTVQKNGANVDSFTANQATNKTINITMAKSDVGLGNVPNEDWKNTDITVTADSFTNTTTDTAAKTSTIVGHFNWLRQKVNGIIAVLGSKQDKLSAGDNVTIDGNTISATGENSQGDDNSLNVADGQGGWKVVEGWRSEGSTLVNSVPCGQTTYTPSVIHSEHRDDGETYQSYHGYYVNPGGLNARHGYSDQSGSSESEVNISSGGLSCTYASESNGITTSDRITIAHNKAEISSLGIGDIEETGDKSLVNKEYVDALVDGICFDADNYYTKTDTNTLLDLRAHANANLLEEANPHETDTSTGYISYRSITSVLQIIWRKILAVANVLNTKASAADLTAHVHPHSHVTLEDKLNWDNKVPHSTLNAAMINHDTADRHVNPNEREVWNAKYGMVEVDAAIGRHANNSSHVTVAEKQAWDAKFNEPTGTSSQYIRGDGTVSTFPAIPAAANLTSQSATAGQASRSGTATTFARSDHYHELPHAPTLLTLAAAPASHTHIASDINAGTLVADRIPNLDAGKITSGAFADARIPNLAASKITSGTFADARIASAATWNGKQNALNRTVTGNDNATGTVTDSGGNLSIPQPVTTTAASATATQLAAGTHTLRTAVQRLVNNIANLFANKAQIGTISTTTGQYISGITLNGSSAPTVTRRNPFALYGVENGNINSLTREPGNYYWFGTTTGTLPSGLANTAEFHLEIICNDVSASNRHIKQTLVRGTGDTNFGIHTRIYSANAWRPWHKG